MDQADAWIFAGKRADDLGGAVGGVVIDEDSLPAQAGEYDVEACNDFANVGAFVIRRQDDGEVQA